jgi:hypothetical protein
MDSLLAHFTEVTNQLDIVCDQILGGDDLILDEESIVWISDHIDFFVRKCRSNESVRLVVLKPDLLIDDDDYYNWDKVGQAIGNLQALVGIDIIPDYIDEDEDDDDELIPDWEKLGRILSHVRQRITLDITPFDTRESAWRIEESRSFARAIHGHPTITRFDGGEGFPYESLDTLYSALATLPALESIQLSHRGLITRPEDETTLASHASLTALLRRPSLRSVSFVRFSFTTALCQATAKVFTEGTFITSLEFKSCTFPTNECAAILMNDFSRYTSAVSFGIQEPLDVALSSVLSATLPSSSTIRNLSFLSVSAVHLLPIFLALGKNTGLESLRVDLYDSTMGESLCTAMTDGLESNKALESLQLNNIGLSADNAVFWCRTFSFLRTNKTLKSLKVTSDPFVTESPSAFLIDIAGMLQENASLESLTIRVGHAIKAKEYCALITVIQHNMTLKTLTLRYPSCVLQLTEPEDKQMAALLKKNYALENLPYIQGEDMEAILRLNKAGRRYLIEDGSSISKGVEVLIAVSSETNCVLIHLLENPTLCDRSAVEIVNSGTRATVD